MPLIESFTIDHTTMKAPQVRKAKVMNGAKGDVVEVFGPNIETFSFIVPDIYDNDGNKVNVGRHPEEILRFKLDKKVYKDDMIRIKID